ncbi:MAG: hypothetical protein U0Q15_09300 [Kineosporiaceae bacterium]
MSDTAAGAAQALVVEVLAQMLDVEEPTVEQAASLADLPGWDSVNALRTLVFLEREAGAPLDFARYAAATTVADVVAVVEAVLGAGLGAGLVAP